jgi:hypothetical protein
MLMHRVVTIVILFKLPRLIATERLYVSLLELFLMLEAMGEVFTEALQ